MHYYCCVDMFGVTLNAVIYGTKAREEEWKEYRKSGKYTQYVLSAVRPYFGTNRKYAMDRLFGGVGPVMDFTDRGLQVITMTCLNRKGLPDKESGLWRLKGNVWDPKSGPGKNHKKGDVVYRGYANYKGPTGTSVITCTQFLDSRVTTVLSNFVDPDQFASMSRWKKLGKGDWERIVVNTTQAQSIYQRLMNGVDVTDMY